MRMTDHVTLNFNNSFSMAAVFLDFRKAFDTTRYPGLVYKLSKLHFSFSLIKLISSFLSNRKFRAMVEDNLPRPLKIHKQGCCKVPLASTLYSMYINDTPQTPGVHTHTRDCKEGYVLRKLQCSLTSVESWCEHWNIKINEDNMPFTSPTDADWSGLNLTLKGHHIPLINNVKYLSVIIIKKLHGNYI
jgi:hypothetical protein